MKHIHRAAILTILLLIAVFCLSAPAWANVWTPKSLKEIGDEAFMGVPMQKNYAVRTGIETIGARAFVNTGVELVWLPNTLKYIAPDAFDKTAGFVCSPGTYAEQWCRDNGYDYDYIKPYLSVDKKNLHYGETATLTADPVFGKEPTSYIWETRGRERYWSVVEGETGPILRYTNTEEDGYIKFRVSCVWDDVCSVPSDLESIFRYSNKITFDTEKCKALSGDAVYLEWNSMGSDADYKLYQWKPDEQKPDDGEWTWIDSFKGTRYCTVYGLEKNTEYSFYLSIPQENSDDERIVSEPITITTGDDETSLNMQEFYLDGQALYMTWLPIEGARYDIYYGNTKDNLKIWASNRWRTDYQMYDFPLNQTRYVQVRARIPNTNYEFWGPVRAVTPTEEGPKLTLDPVAYNSDVANVSWKLLPGCTYDVYLHAEGVEKTLIEEKTDRNYLDIGGLKPGDKWYVSVTAKFGKWSTTSAEAEICVDPLDEVVYRALLIGEATFDGKMNAPRNYGNVERLSVMLDNVKTPDGTYYSYVRRKDLSRDGILAAITETFSEADDNDVSLFFISTHGNVSKVGRYAGALCTVETPTKFGLLLQEELRDALQKIKGTKIVWLSACGTGAGVYDFEHPEEENYADPYYGEYDEDEWDGWPIYEFDNGGDDFYLGDDAAFDTGELRQPDFQVLTAARYRYVGYGNNDENCSYFVKYLTEGVFDPNEGMPADLDGNGELTQHELFSYIKWREEDPETGSDQDVQAYPVNSDYVLFKK